MPRFAFRALSATGELVSGELDGPDAGAVIERLHEQALVPIDAVERRARGPAWLELRRRRRRGISTGDLALLTQQLARLLKAGLPLDRALEILVRLAPSRPAATALSGTLNRVRDGASLAEAMAAQRPAFPDSYVSMVRAGEQAAALTAVLPRVGDFLARSEANRQKIVSALIYPAILVAAATVSVVVVLTVVLPEFEPLFAEAGARLPWGTRLVMAVGHTVRDAWWGGLLALAVGLLAGRRLLQRPGVALARDRLLLRLPVVRDLSEKIEIGRFARTLGVLLANGILAPRALALAGAAVGNRAIALAVETVATRLKEGEGLSGPLSRTGRFPSLVTQLIAIGEETGRVEEMLHEVADIYDDEAERTAQRLLAMLAPAITIAMGLVVALIIVAILGAMISINDLAI